MDDDDLSLGDLRLEDPEHPLPRRERHRVDMSAEAVAQRKRERMQAVVESEAPTLPGKTAGDAAAQPFAVVPFQKIKHAAPPAPAYWWDGYMPASVVTLLGAHGGTGKSTIALMLAVCIALGLPLFGIPTKRGRVAFFSGEDSAELMLFRLRWICTRLSVDVEDLDGWLFILDATANDPALFHEVSIAGKRQGQTTYSYTALLEFIEAQDIDVLIVDNASDTYDASEIDRARVRGFMRALANLAHPDRGVLLLAHIDKGTSRGDRGTHTEGYSGSTAWHNSARSRLYLARDKDGTLLLEHQKHNLGMLAAPLRLLWPDGGIPQLDVPVNGMVQHIADNADTKALLRLLHEFYGRGEFVATDPHSRRHAVKVLGDEATFPKRLKTADVFGLLRSAERRSLIEREPYKDKYRRTAERWNLTPQGLSVVGLAASAQVQQVPESSEPAHPQQSTAASAQVPALGGMGECVRAESTRTPAAVGNAATSPDRA